MGTINPFAFAFASAGNYGSPCGMSNAAPGSVWGQDSLQFEMEALCSELAPLLRALEGGGGQQGCGQPMPGMFPGGCQSGSGSAPAACAGAFPGSSPCGSGSTPGACHAGCESSPQGQRGPDDRAVPTVVFEGGSTGNGPTGQKTSTQTLANGDIEQDTTYTGGTDSQLVSMQRVFDPRTGVDHAVETAANGHHAYVDTTVQNGNQITSNISGDADVTNGVSRMVTTFPGNNTTTSTEYKTDGSQVSWTNTNSAGQTLKAWGEVPEGNSSSANTWSESANPGGGMSVAYDPNSIDNYVQTYL